MTDAGEDDSGVTRLLAAGLPNSPVEQRRVEEALAHRLFGVSSSPIALDRYLLLRRLSAGGGGVVYVAYDPELDRRVAVKLIRLGRQPGDRDGEARTRLMREAQAMARLSHPNVVPVYDVGSYDLPRAFGDAESPERGVYVVMELVEGLDLARWLGREPRPWREIVQVFAAAGRGLAAAHAAGLIHRDFKPANVLLGDDGRVRVADFGLARDHDAPITEAHGDPAEPRPISDHGTEARRSPLRAPITSEGTVLGTPIYMPPEQHGAAAVDARGDQFSFCVALFEALYGQRPFSGRTVSELARNKLAGAIRPIPAAARVPPWLEEAVLRGLAPDPARRFPDMPALLAVLERDRSRRRTVVAVAIVAAATAGLGTALRGVDDGPAPCDARAELAGIWDPAVAARVERAFVASGRPFADTAFVTTRAELDAWTGRWVELRDDACRAARAGGPSIGQLGEQALCLDRRLLRLGGWTRLLQDADAELVDHAAAGVAELPSLDPCADPRPVVAPAPAIERDDTLALEAELTDVVALTHAGRYDAARVPADAALARARDLGDDAAAARTWLTVAALREQSAAATEAEHAYREALLAAERAGDAELATEAMVALVHVVGALEERHEEAGQLAVHAGARLERLDSPDLRSALDYNLGTVRLREGRYADATEAFERTLEHTRRRKGEHHPLVATRWVALGSVEEAAGEYRRALEHYERALEIRRESLGDQHPLTATCRGLVASALYQLGEWDRALPLLEEAITGARAALGPDHRSVAALLNAEGGLLSESGRLDASLATHERALEIRERALGPWHADVATSLQNIAYVSTLLGQYERALPRAERAVEIRRRAQGPTHPEYGHGLAIRGYVLAGLGRHAEAIESHEQALRILELRRPGHHRLLGFVSRELGESLLEAGRVADARPVLERALATQERGRRPPNELAPTRLALARTLATTEPARARTLAQAALGEWERAGDRTAAELARAWLAEHSE
jgi:serine/threonine-protein kinase